jgi:uncharacterized membrane protein
MNERIENKRTKLSIKAIIWLLAIVIILFVLKVFAIFSFIDEHITYSDLISSPIGLIVYFLITYRQNGPIIEWKGNSIIFKEKKKKETRILLADIQDISILFNSIEIKTIKRQHSLSLENFFMYKDRIRIKENFEKLKQGLK